jgi:hypothetical protein
VNTRTGNTPLRSLLFIASLCLAIAAPSGGQNTKPSNPSTETNAQASAQLDKSKLTPPPGKMRGTTNEMRKAAAIRTADRKAKAQVKAKNANQTEVKQ